MQIGRRQVEAAAIHIRLGAGKAIRLRADHAAVDDALIQIGLCEHHVTVADGALLELGEHRDLARLERRFEAIRETHAVGVVMVDRRLDDDVQQRGADSADDVGGAVG